MKIEFIGYDDDGLIVGSISDTTKYIPIRLTNITFDVKATGTRYDVIAIPTSHFGFNQTTAALHVPVEVEASTVGEFFFGPGRPDGKWGWTPNASNSSNTNVKGLKQSWNDYHNSLTLDTGNDRTKSQPRDIPDTIDFMIHPDIAKAKLESKNLSKLGMLTKATRNHQTDSVFKATYGFHKGTHINTLTQKIITASTWWGDQETKQANAIAQNNRERAFRGTSDKPRPNFDDEALYSPKVAAVYEMGEFDTKANRHAYKVTFIISPYETSSTFSDKSKKSPPKNIARHYNYLFTGKNQDILDLNIKFNLAFYQNVSAGTKHAGDGTKTSTASNKDVNKGTGTANNKDYTSGAVVNEVVHDSESGSSNINESEKSRRGEELRRSIMTDSAADMIRIEMDILGDPDWIKQDDVLHRSVGPNVDTKSPYTKTHSIKQDTGDVFVNLKFNVLDDIDHNTGLREESRQIPGTNFSRASSFDGYYQILSIISRFENGSFEQTLNGVRSYIQTESALNKAESEKTPNTTDSSINDARETAIQNGAISDVIEEIESGWGPGVL